MTNLFSRLSPYGYIHHRALNDFESLEKAEKYIAAYPDKAQVLEGDVCWDFTSGGRDFYFRHPSYVVDTLSREQIAAMRRQRKLVTLDDLLARDSENKFYVIELKVGRGDARAALQTLVETLQKQCRGRFWIDGFSLRLLQLVKSIDETVCTSVHTELVTDTHILLDAPEWPPLRFIKLRDLQGVDAVAIRKRFSDPHMERASAAVRKHGFSLIMSRLFTLQDYRFSRKSGTVAGYPKAAFDSIMQYDREHMSSQTVAPALHI